MDFFKSVFSNDPDPDPSNAPQDDEQEQEDDVGGAGGPSPPAPPAASAGAGGAWNFGGLMKTFASKSESVIQTYRRDLEEFGSGLKKETAAIREAATRAVRDLPVSLEAGASVTQESLESVGQAIDEFGGSVWRGTAEIVSHGKEALLSIDSDASSPISEPLAGSSKRYNRFEAQVVAIQSDPSTFTDEPDDAGDYHKWKSGFDLGAEEEEIENLCYENGSLESLFEKLVPGVMDYDTFWSRYYYKVHKLKQAEDARADLVKRVISREEDEELSWEVDDDDEEEEKKEGTTNVAEAVEEKDDNKEEVKEIAGTSEPTEEKTPTEVSQDESSDAGSKMPDEELATVVGKEEQTSMVGKEEDDEPNDGDATLKAEDKIQQDAKADPGESGKDSDFSVVSSQPSVPEEDDLGWDEIEDLGENDDKKVVSSGGSPNRADLRKRLSAAEDDEDLSWDIEEDDEPAKS